MFTVKVKCVFCGGRLFVAILLDNCHPSSCVKLKPHGTDTDTDTDIKDAPNV